MCGATTEPAAHDWDENSVCTVCQAGCDHIYGAFLSNGDGTHTHECTICGHTETGTHSYTGSVTVFETCEDDGEMIYICGDCNDYYYETIYATGHYWSGWTVTPATATEDGERTRVCYNCGDTEREVIPATGETDIPEEDPPLTPGPASGDDDGDIDIPEGDVPLASVPQTGDNSGIWVFTAALSATGLAVLFLIGKCRKEDEEA